MTLKRFVDDLNALEVEALKSLDIHGDVFSEYLVEAEGLLEDLVAALYFLEEEVLAKRIQDLSVIPHGRGCNDTSGKLFQSHLRRVTRVLSLIRPDVSIAEPEFSPALVKEHVGSNRKSKRIFMVHGHDEEIKQKAARTLEQFGLQPIILAEQPNSGQTIVEKFEKHSDVDFAVVLMTGDDLGRAKPDTNKMAVPRARQNVVLELGYFVGKLSRSGVCVLLEAGVEAPSDIHGIVYTPIDSNDSWKYALGKELQATGYEIDLNDL